MKRLAMFYEQEKDKVRCKLCPHGCLLKAGQKGICRVREAETDHEGILQLYTLNYGDITAIALDPIEKKPLTHYKPHAQILSIGSFGCNLGCMFCQNHVIAHGNPKVQSCSAENMVKVLDECPDSIGLAFTYNEPTVWYEYVYEVARLLKALKPEKKVVLVTNGYINEEPLRMLLPYVDAMNVDLKGDQNFYQKLCKGSLEEVKQTIQIAYEKGVHVEVTTLLIESENTHVQQMQELADFLCHISPEIPLHLSRYFPNYQMTLPPTDFEVLKKAYKLFRSYLHYVEVGNISYEEQRLLQEEKE